jgi:hypothetical protein
VHGRRLVADVHQLQAGADGRIEDGHDVIAGQREHVAQAHAFENAGEDVGAPDRGGHVSLPVCCIVVQQ